jgi:hypothetical protein
VKNNIVVNNVMKAIDVATDTVGYAGSVASRGVSNFTSSVSGTRDAGAGAGSDPPSPLPDTVHKHMHIGELSKETAQRADGAIAASGDAADRESDAEAGSGMATDSISAQIQNDISYILQVSLTCSSLKCRLLPEKVITSPRLLLLRTCTYIHKLLHAIPKS